MKLAVVDSGWKYTVDTPYEHPLGGTQSAICYFLEEMASRGHETYLFNQIEQTKILRGVTHVNSNNILNLIKANKLVFDLIIISCIPNDLLQIKLALNNPKTMFGLWTGHDIDQNPSLILKDTKMVDFIDLFIFVSDWQRIRFIEKYEIPWNKTLILRNGIGKPFEKYLDLPNNKNINSMTYCSIPWRGLELMIPIYKTIKQKYINSSLKIFSGMNIYQQQEKPGLFDEFQNMKNVKCSYGISQTKLAEELSKIDYLTYPNTFQETSCITALQAMACGCLVVTSNLGALKETMNGLNEYVDINIHNFNVQKYVNDFTSKLSDVINLNHKNKEKLREINKQYIRENYLYKIICQKFEMDIQKIFDSYLDQTLKYNVCMEQFMKHFSENNYVEALKLSSNFLYHYKLNDYYVLKLNQGVCLNSVGQIKMSIKFLKIAKSVSDNYNINKNLALIHLEKNDLQKFVKYARHALGIEFNTQFANLLAEKYDLMGLHHEAVGLYNSIIKLEPDNVNCLNNLGNLYLITISDTKDFDGVMKKTYCKSLDWAVKKKEHRKTELILSNIIFNNLYNWKLTNEEIHQRSSVWYDYFPKEQQLLDIVNKLDRTKTSTGKIRIGYISTDFMTHPVGFMFDSILRNHNINKFEIFCYDNSNSTKSSNDVIAKKLRAYNNARWFSIENLSDVEILTQMINDNLDILVDMMGHTRNTRMNVLQYKPARIIVSYFAYPSTNGLKEIDYRFTDKFASPPETQKFFTEKFYYLPNGFQCYTPPIDIDSTKNYSREKYKIHLCCFNNPIKLSRPTIETFAEILKRLPESKLFLRYCYYKSSYFRERMLKQFVELGIDTDRISIDSLDLEQSLKFYNQMDIVLDPFPYNGGTISSEAIYMNSPLITLAGSNYVSRVGVSLLSNLGLQKYIANSREEYVQKVIDLARNPKELKELHQTLRIRMLNSDLANSVSFTHNVEAAYQDMINKFN